MNRRLKKTSLSEVISPEFISIESFQEMTEIPPAMVTEHKIDECQVNFYSESDVNSQTFICHRFIIDKICHAETQTEIVGENTR